MLIGESVPRTAYTCPECAWTGEFDARFAMWCEACGAGAVTAKGSRKPRALRREAATRKRQEALFAELLVERDLRAGGGTRLAIGVFSAAVHLVTLTLAAGAIALIAGFGHVVGWILGLYALAIAWVVRPRPIRPAEHRRWLTSAEAPKLFTVMARMATSVGAPTPHQVCITAEYNASTQRIGWRGRPVVTIGAPLWAALDGPGRAALLGHEVAHQVNGDATRGVLAASASRSLHEWRHLLYLVDDSPSGTWHRRGIGISGLLAELVLPILMLPFYLLVTGLAMLHARLWRRASPRAEYVADAVAAKVAGSEAITEVLDALLLSESATRFVVLLKNRRDTAEIWSKTTAYLRSLPDHEVKRHQVESLVAGAAIDTTHPPTAFRRRLVAERAQQTGTATIDASEWAQVDAELAPTMARVAQDLTLL